MHRTHPNNARGNVAAGISPEALMARSTVVVYRTGTLFAFTWHRTAPFDALRAAALADGYRRMGYSAHVEDAARSLAIGLPETWSGDDEIVDAWDAWRDEGFVSDDRDVEPGDPEEAA